MVREVFNGERPASEGAAILAALRDLAAANGEPKQVSGKQEMLENLVNQLVFG